MSRCLLVPSSFRLLASSSDRRHEIVRDWLLFHRLSHARTPYLVAAAVLHRKLTRHPSPMATVVNKTASVTADSGTACSAVDYALHARPTCTLVWQIKGGDFVINDVAAVEPVQTSTPTRNRFCISKQVCLSTTTDEQTTVIILAYDCFLIINK